MAKSDAVRILFVVNPNSGKDDNDWEQTIAEFFKDKDAAIDVLQLEKDCDPKVIDDRINDFAPGRVVAVGGDGTVKLVAERLLDKPSILLGIIPAGSANGMAKELSIPLDPKEALNVAMTADARKIHLVKVNEHICIHLSDVGFNAFVIKLFENQRGRGMWGYVKASWKALWQHDKFDVKIRTNDEVVERSAAMIVIANATKYGSGALINPDGELSDRLFEVIVVRKISLPEIFKMMVTHRSYDPAKTEVFQCSTLDIKSRHMAHFQVDGEYLGKIRQVHAELLPSAIRIIAPVEKKA